MKLEDILMLSLFVLFASLLTIGIFLPNTSSSTIFPIFIFYFLSFFIIKFMYCYKYKDDIKFRDTKTKLSIINGKLKEKLNQSLTL